MTFFGLLYSQVLSVMQNSSPPLRLLCTRGRGGGGDASFIKVRMSSFALGTWLAISVVCPQQKNTSAIA